MSKTWWMHWSIGRPFVSRVKLTRTDLGTTEIHQTPPAAALWSRFRPDWLRTLGEKTESEEVPGLAHIWLGILYQGAKTIACQWSLMKTSHNNPLFQSSTYLIQRRQTEKHVKSYKEPGMFKSDSARLTAAQGQFSHHKSEWKMVPSENV